MKMLDQKVTEGPHYDPDDGLMLGKVRCRLWVPVGAQNEGPNSEDQEKDVVEAANILECEANFVVAFKLEHPVSNVDATRFFESTAGFAVWPYFRSHIASMAAQSRVNLAPLPLKTLLQRVPETKAEE